MKVPVETGEKLQARIKELKACEGKTYRPKFVNPLDPHVRMKVAQYNGVGKLQDGEMAHLFLLESKTNWMGTVDALRFLKEHEEVFEQ